MANFLKQHGVTTIKTKSGVVDVDTISAKRIGLYFSAHWCPPCRAFTPVLSEVYDELQRSNPDELYLIFVSSDSDVSSFNGYHGDMTFSAIPFQDREAAENLAATFGIRGIPALIIIDKDGKVLTKEGRELVNKNKTDTSQLVVALNAL